MLLINKKRSLYIIYLVISLICAMLSIIGDQFNVGIIDYVIFFLFFLFSFVIFMSKGQIVIPRGYMLILISYIILSIISSYFSQYTLGVKYVAIGTIITLLPFLVFIISYNYDFSVNTINKMMDVWIYFIAFLCMLAFIETLLFKSNVASQEGILKVSIIKPGFFASMSNQGVILSLYKYSLDRNPKYKKIAIFFIACSFLTIQLKVIAGLFIIGGLFYIFFINKSKSYLVLIILFVVSIGSIAVINIPPLYDKVSKYVTLYGASDSFESVARPALYFQSINIANDFFPLGSGQGTFGSVPVNMKYNNIYYDYGLNYIHGLGESGPNYKMDTHWSSILGENGYLGTLLYLILFYYPLFFLKRIKKFPIYDSMKFLMMAIFIVITIESITLCIPNRMAFMFIYSGFLGLFCRQISLKRVP